MTTKAEKVFNAMAIDMACAVCLKMWAGDPGGGLCTDVECQRAWRYAAPEDLDKLMERWRTFCDEHGINILKGA